MEQQLKFFDEKRELVSLNDIHKGYNPRSNLGDLSSLKQSIQQLGLLNPIIIRNNGHTDSNKKYELVCGHRRFEACQKLGYSTIPANIRTLSDEQSFHLSFIDNDEREGYNPIDEANHYKKAQADFGYSTRTLAEQYGNGDTYYKYKLQLLELPNEVVTRVTNKELSEGHCRHISKLVNKKNLIKRFEELYDTTQKEWTNEQQQKYKEELKKRQELQINLAENIIENEWSVRRTQDEAKTLLQEINEYDENLNKQIEEKKKELSILDNIYFKSSWDMNELSDKSIPLIITSPDYYASKEYESKDFNDFKTNLTNIFNECIRVLQPGGRLCINIGDIPNLNGNGMFLIGCFLNNIFEKTDVKLVDKILWKKDDPWFNNPHIRFDKQEGNYRILPSTEYIFIYKKQGKRDVKPSLKMKGGIKKDEWKQWVSGLWNIPSVRKNDDHPAKFPQELVERLVLMYSFPEDRILDPCLGSGTTAIVSKKLGRTPYGYEKNMSYKETILKNLKEVHNAEIN